MLKHWRDTQSLLYLIAQPALIAYQWVNGVHFVAYALVLFLSLGVGVIHHNHAHLSLWRYKPLNRVTDLWLTLLQGHPTYVFIATHMDNHHRYHHGPLDVARTYRFGGDTNHLWGYMTHPIYAAFALYPVFLTWMKRCRARKSKLVRYALQQYLCVAVLWASLAWLDMEKWLVLVLLPQLHGLHWLLTTNYLQHAHADGHSKINYARNFDGLVNPLLFNIGIHTAHHEHPRAHWSTLPNLHMQYRSVLDPRLQAGGLLPYMWRTFVLALFMPRYRSVSAMKASPSDASNSNNTP